MFCLWSFVITKRLFVVLVITNLYFSLCFVFDFVPSLLCRGVRVRVVYFLFVNGIIPWWRSLCGRSLADSWNPSVSRRGRIAMARTSKHILMFAIDYLPLSQLSQLLISCISIIVQFILTWYCLCAHTCIKPRELLKHLNS